MIRFRFKNGTVQEVELVEVIPTETLTKIVIQSILYTKATNKRKISNVSPSSHPEKFVLAVEADKNNLMST